MITEVQVQFAKENPAWIPLETLSSNAKRYKVSKKIKDQKLILTLASHHVEDLVALLEDNPYKSYMYQHLNPIKYELLRQLNNLIATETNGKDSQS